LQQTVLSSGMDAASQRRQRLWGPVAELQG
jgi:hypothetical protein